MPPTVDPYKLIPDVQAILRAWDPIGVFSLPDDRPWPSDEYDSYAPAVLSLLMRGATEEQVADHLEALRTESMGLQTHRGADEATAAELVRWWERVREPAA